MQGHYIKDRRSSTAKAVLSLESSHKWALSGTPLQNRVGELYSLVSVLYVVTILTVIIYMADMNLSVYRSVSCKYLRTLIISVRIVIANVLITGKYFGAFVLYVVSNKMKPVIY